MAMGGTEDVQSPFGSDLDATLASWGKAHECGALRPGALRAFWAAHVPTLLSPPLHCRPLALAYDEPLVRRVLFDSLERFVCGGSEPKDYFAELRKLESPPALCGRVFKSGEPTYSCRDCGLDPTCVLCVDCFKSSAHKNHKYKMSMSCGGGYCDCGDSEAWKEFPFCDKHGQNKQEADSDPVERLPPDLVSRVQLVLRTALLYCHQLLTWSKATELPSDLDPTPPLAQATDTYVTMLFNDETHTYEQVIQTLGRAIECSQREAIEFATTIDREGRSLVRSSTFMDCNQVKNHIERITSRHGGRPLRVQVMHASVVAHQVFAMRLLTWVQHFLTQCQAFRLVFSDVMLEPTPEDGFPLLRAVMRSDTQLWKTARAQWHQLFIGGMLMDARCKRAFACNFTRDYPDLLKDFVADDHEHPVSVTSLSVQIFTVPTLAQLLIAEESALTVLLRTFLSECEKHRGADGGKLTFERNQLNVAFRRAQYVLYDLRYLLSVPPEVWTEKLRKGFLYGVGSLLTLLSWMQGMDAVVRQVGQHVEFEAEWETGINLQLKLAPVVALVLEWCGTDREVAIKALRKALRALESPQGRTVGRELADHSASCIEYDVSSMPVSVHLPLSRFVAGLLLCLDRFGLCYDSHELQMRGKPTPEQLLEMPLRTQVMVAQFRAGMWRRNGYSLLNQIYFYHNVRLRSETYDRDVTLLQATAALLESNEFLVHLLNKYALLGWAGDADANATTPDEAHLTASLAEEFLGLVLTLVSERSQLGVGAVTEEDRLRKEIIQLLCVEPLPHSQLLKLLPRDGGPGFEAQVERVLAQVAEFRRDRGGDDDPVAAPSGRYELKHEFYCQFNPFFYHYTREDQSRAEEAQLRRRRQAGEEPCCPPPVPPEFARPFAMVVNLLQCDVMLKILSSVLQRATSTSHPSFSETQLEKALHLVGVALHEEQRLREKGIPTAESFFAFTSAAVRAGIVDALEKCSASAKNQGQKSLVDLTLRRFRALLEGGSENPSAPMELDESSAASQRSGRNAEAAAARRARIMAQMSAMQKNFIREYSDLFKEAAEADSATSQQTNPCHTCILCREDEELSLNGRTLVLSALVQRSTVLSKDRSRRAPQPPAGGGAEEEGSGEEKDENVVPVPSDLYYGPHTSTCGHVMHSRCWQKFFESVVSKERRRPVRYGRHISFNVEKREFLCPLCGCLSNAVIPILPPVSQFAPAASRTSHPGERDPSFEDWLAGIRIALDGTQTELRKTTGPGEDKPLPRHHPLQLKDVVREMNTDAGLAFLRLFSRYEEPPGSPAEGAEFSAGLVEMLKLFSQACYTVGLDVHPNTEDDRVPAMVWWSCTYTIHGTEWLLRGKPLLGDLSSRRLHCLEALVRSAAASLRVFQAGAVQSHCVRLLRHLFGGSDSCCLDVDAFGMLVALSLALPSLFREEGGGTPFPLGSVMDAYLFRLVLGFHLVQVTLTTETSDTRMETDDSERDESMAPLADFCREILVAAGVPQVGLVDAEFVSRVREGLVPFLRCSAIFLHFLADRPAPDSLCRPGGDTWETLCEFLAVPVDVASVLTSAGFKRMALGWVRHVRVKQLLEGSGGTPVHHPLAVNRLVQLPLDFSELINEASLFRCPNSDGDDSRSPALCLVCGTLLCSQSYCCQGELDGERVGACNQHAHACGAGVGLFLRVRDCKVLLLVGRTKGCYVPPPYVDEYGETDPGLTRGNPLRLCPRRFEHLQKLWLSHGIPEQVGHALEQSTSLSSTNWSLM